MLTLRCSMLSRLASRWTLGTARLCSTEASSQSTTKAVSRSPRSNVTTEGGQRSVRQASKYSRSRASGVPKTFLSSRLVDVGRVVKVTKFGKVSTFRALVVAGNGNGAAGFGIGRAQSRKEAVDSALATATKNMVPLHFSPEGTLYHDIIGKHNNTLVLMRSVNAGSMNGIRASKLVVAVCEVVGLKHVVSKILTRGKNPYTIVNAIFNGFGKHSHPDEIALKRGRKIERMFN